MPCAKGMRACHAKCLHRATVLAYRDARDAYLKELEDRTSLYRAEVADYKRDHPGPTFKAWLEGQAGQRERYQDDDVA